MTSSSLSTHECSHSFSHLGWVSNYSDAIRFQASYLRFSVSLSTSNNSTGVTHSSAGWCSLSSNEADNWQFAMIMFWKPFSSLFLCFSTNLTNHNNSLSLWVINEAWKDINEVSSIERITSNTNDSGLSKVELSCLVNSFVCQGSWSWDNTNLSLLMNIAGHDTDFAFSWFDDTWAIWTNKSSLVLWLHDWFNLDHIKSWDSLSNTHYKFHLSLNCFQNGISSEWWWYIDDWSFSWCGFLGLGNVTEDWESQMNGSLLPLINTTNYISTIFNWFFRMEGTLIKYDVNKMVVLIKTKLLTCLPVIPCTSTLVCWLMKTCGLVASVYAVLWATFPIMFTLVVFKSLAPIFDNISIISIITWIN